MYSCDPHQERVLKINVNSYLLLLWLLEQVRFSVNKHIIAFEQHVTRGWRAPKPNGVISWFTISRGFVRDSIQGDLYRIIRLKKKSKLKFLQQDFFIQSVNTQILFQTRCIHLKKQINNFNSRNKTILFLILGVTN